MWGHLSMGHDLDGEELERAYEESKASGGKPGRSARKPRSCKNKKLQELPEKVGTPAASEENSGDASGQEGRDRIPVPAVSGAEESGEEDENQKLAPAPEAEEAEVIEESSRRGRSASDVEEALDRLRRAKQRLQTVKESTGEEVEKDVSRGGVISTLLKGKKTKTVVERTDAEQEELERCRREVEEAKEEYARALDHRQIEHEYNRADETT
jgi:hypothetical protein